MSENEVLNGNVSRTRSRGKKTGNRKRSLEEATADTDALDPDLIDESSQLHEELQKTIKEVEGSDEEDSEGEQENTVNPSIDAEGEAQLDVSTTTPGQPTRISSCGTVSQIECLDFMCHRHMSVKLGSRINFITGQNGSGKSAILAALQVCLGMNAKDTHRGSKLKNLIRHGSNANAICRVTLNNDGVDAYHPEKYGKSITVERTIRRNGGSSYRLLSHGKTCISTRKMDLDEIRDRFNLFVDNPCCILDQENAKAFLKGNSSQKYNLFLKATELEKMMTNLQSEKIVRKRNEVELSDRKKELPVLEQRLKEAEGELEDLERMDKLKDELDLTKMHKAWAVVQQYKSDYEVEEAKVEKAQAKVDKNKKKLEEAIKAKEEKSGEHKELEKIVASAMGKLDECKSTQKRAQAELNQATQPRMELSRKLKAEESQVQRYKNQLTDMKKAVALLREKQMTKDIETEKKNLHMEIEKYTREKSEAEDRIKSHESEADQTHSDIDNLQSELQNAKKLLNQSKYELKAREQEYEDLLATQQDRSARFGKWLPKLLDVIEKNSNKFHRKPVHCGLHVELKEMAYWRPVESCIGGILQSFIVNDSHDMALLKKFAQQYKLPAIKITILRFLDKRHATASRTVDQRLLTIERAIDVTDDNVFNCLVDMASIEGQVLVESTDVAMRETFLGPKGQKRMPRGMRQCFNKDGDVFTVKGGSETKVASANRAPEPRYFAQDVSSRIEPCKLKIEEIKHEIQHHSKNINEREMILSEKKARIQKLKKEQKILVTQMSQFDNSIVELSQRQLEFESDETEVEINEKQNDIKDIEIQISETKAKVEELKKAYKRVEEKIKPLKEAVDEQKNKFSQLNEEAESARNRLSSWEKDFSPLIHNVAKYENLVKSKIEKLEDLNSIVSTKKTKFENAERGALTFCKGKRFEVTDNEAKLDKKMKQITKKIENEAKRLEKSNEDPAMLLAMAKRKVERAATAVAARKNSIKIVKARIKSLKNASKQRLSKWRHFREHVQRITSDYFNYYLTQRNHSGNVHFDDDKGEINFTWSKTANAASEAGEGNFTDTRQLSGGEKSFTTLAFLLSIGKVIECPFRVMDEFDVFMDDGNRKTAMNLLLEMARDKSNDKSQFIFITPNDISMIVDSNDVKKLKMMPLEKDYGRVKQTTLPFQAR